MNANIIFILTVVAYSFYIENLDAWFANNISIILHERETFKLIDVLGKFSNNSYLQ